MPPDTPRSTRCGPPFWPRLFGSAMYAAVFLVPGLVASNSLEILTGPGSLALAIGVVFGFLLVSSLAESAGGRARIVRK